MACMQISSVCGNALQIVPDNFRFFPESGRRLDFRDAVKIPVRSLWSEDTGRLQQITDSDSTVDASYSKGIDSLPIMRQNFNRYENGGGFR